MYKSFDEAFEHIFGEPRPQQSQTNSEQEPVVKYYTVEKGTRTVSGVVLNMEETNGN